MEFELWALKTLLFGEIAPPAEALCTNGVFLVNAPDTVCATQ